MRTTTNTSIGGAAGSDARGVARARDGRGAPREARGSAPGARGRRPWGWLALIAATLAGGCGDVPVPRDLDVLSGGAPIQWTDRSC